MTTKYIGQPQSRVDGRAKVTGAAKYVAEYNVPDLLYGVVVPSEIAKGKIKRIDASVALAVEGVVHVFTHENRQRTALSHLKYKDFTSPLGTPFRPLRDEHIVHSEQPIALVVAETFEVARYAALLLNIEYDLDEHHTDLTAMRKKAQKAKPRPLVPPPASPRGNAERAYSRAAVQHEAEYLQPYEHHNPLEMHATTVIYDVDGGLTIYDKTQGVHNSKLYVTNVFGLSSDKVRVLAPFIGGGFGSGLRPEHQLFLAVMASLELKRSVRVSLKRHEMFSFSHRPHAIQKVALGASPDGKLQAIMHEAFTNTSPYENYSEDIVNWSGMMYQCDNVKVEHIVAELDLPTPGDMRAPGAPTGFWALESAMDELSYKLGIDPLELRLINYAEIEQNQNKPFSSKELRACYSQAAEKFGWAQRNSEPRQMREGNYLVGWGMASGSWEALYMPTAARAVLTADGHLEVSSGTADIGTGTYTIMTQIAAETLGLPMEQVTFKLGDTSLPLAPVEGGSMTAASCGSAVKEVCDAVGKKLFELARKQKNSPLAKAKLEDVTFADGHICLNSDLSKSVSITEVMRQSETGSIDETTTSLDQYAAHTAKTKKYARNVHSAVFVEVHVDEDLGTIRVPRVVIAIAGGRILNAKTARSQILGGVVWGIGMGLEEQSVIDQQFGRFMNHDLSEYHVAVNADVHDIEVIFVEEHDEIVNPIGVKGLGEIGIVGVAAAIGNAVYHATGVRVRELPITLDKVLAKLAS